MAENQIEITHKNKEMDRTPTPHGNAVLFLGKTEYQHSINILRQKQMPLEQLSVYK